MKKLVVAALALCAAYGAQAMAVSWKATGTSTMQNYNAYLIVGSVSTDWASETAISAASVDGAHALSSKSGPSYYTGAVTSKGGSLSKTADMYVVLVDKDSKKFAVSGTFAGSTYVYNDEATPPESATATLSWSATSSTTFSDFKSTPTPEPTSAMLLLLGVAGLALKRKRA